MQEQLLQERCIVVDENDCQVRAETKLVCHQMVNINAGLLHRAFSLFVFSKGRLLLQQRALAKVTFPAYLTNSCCSHPLYCDQERNETRHIGIKTAVLRKLTHELGIATGLVHADQLQFLTRIHYKAAYDAVWYGLSKVGASTKSTTFSFSTQHMTCTHFLMLTRSSLASTSPSMSSKT